MAKVGLDRELFYIKILDTGLQESANSGVGGTRSLMVLLATLSDGGK